MKTLQDSTFKQLRDFIYEKCGIYISDSKKYLIENRLVKRLQEKKLNSYEDYLYLLLYGNSTDELSKLYDAVTTNETFFFRESQQLDVFVDHIVPELMKKHSTKDIAIWSAACSTGEEPYTIAMMLLEKGYSLKKEIIASDISDSTLESAKKAVYNSYSIRNVPMQYLKKYFKPNGQSYELSPVIKGMVKFMNINLIDERKVKLITSRDVVFCRNVLIYFDDRAKKKAVSLLYDCLKPGGYLIIGLSESLHNITRAFKPVVINKVVVYQRV
ncbi:MAG: protein-glutamate O-methyltransferase CheR [Thermodesulfovibrionales bacterium]|nr:protein-glutamate O-methyltransferase CheR [Thermodesulfovibrionales bacterium]